MVNSSVHGNSTSGVEVLSLGPLGLSLRWNGKDFFLRYEDFPWFRNQPASAVRNIEQPMPGHFHWPELDVDLTDEMIEYPERFPLKARTA